MWAGGRGEACSCAFLNTCHLKCVHVVCPLACALGDLWLAYKLIEGAKCKLPGLAFAGQLDIRTCALPALTLPHVCYKQCPVFQWLLSLFKWVLLVLAPAVR